MSIVYLCYGGYGSVKGKLTRIASYPSKIEQIDSK